MRSYHPDRESGSAQSGTGSPGPMQTPGSNCEDLTENNIKHDFQNKVD